MPSIRMLRSIRAPGVGWKKRCRGTTRLGLPWLVLLAFLRVTTRESILVRSLTPEQALAYVDSWLAQPNVEPIGAGPTHWRVLRNLLRSTGTDGSLASDAHLAALAIEYGAGLYSTDNDFKRFPGVDHVNPLVDR